MAPTIQAQEAIEKMKAAGFKRREFTVRTPGNGRTGFYPEPIITLLSSRERAEERIEAMCKAGLGVKRFVLPDGGLSFPQPVSNSLMEGQYVVFRFNEHGLTEISSRKSYAPERVA